jgi:NADPH:quinone reductase-like Zn-dependent oxidoreductase
MRAMVCEQYGPPDVFQLREVEQPTPADTQVLIRVRAATAGPADCAFRKGTPFIVKLIYGLRKPKFPIMGAELAGEVQAIGRAVTSYKPGDRVLGLIPNGFGAYAEYTCLLESDPLAIIPASMSYDEAVGICDGATTALTFLRDVARLQPGQRVLINGASGAVGAYGVQLAKYFGAEVTGVCSTGNVALVQSLGADAVIDYTSEDFTKTGGQKLVRPVQERARATRCLPDDGAFVGDRARCAAHHAGQRQAGEVCHGRPDAEQGELAVPDGTGRGGQAAGSH